MPGVSTHVPKRSTERRRKNSPTPDTVAPPLEPLAAPELPEDTHKIARDWYDSLRRSGQAVYYEPSDWQAAQFVAATMTRFLTVGTEQSPRGMNAALFASIWSAMSELLTTEGARRRARIEVERAVVTGAADPARPANVTDYRARLTKGGRRG